MGDIKKYDVILIGGGCAAMASAIYTCRAELKTLILERKFVGGQVVITTAVDNYPGFPDGIQGPELTERMRKQAEKFGAVIKSEEVVSLRVEGLKKIVTTDEEVYESPIVILAMGADPRKLDVPGEAELIGRGVSYCGTCDGPFYRGKDVFVVGGGSSAITEAIFITKFVNKLTVIHRRDTLRAEKILQKEAFGNPKMSFIWDSVVENIEGDGKVESVTVSNLKTGKKDNLTCGGVFVFVGNQPNTGFLDGLFSVDAGLHVETNHMMETAVEGVFAIGDVRKNSVRQIATAVGDGVTAAIAAQHKIADINAKGASI